MSCDKTVGVKNIMLGFKPCDGRPAIAQVSHTLYGEELPIIDMTNYRNESLPSRTGQTKRVAKPRKVKLTVEVLKWIPLSYYQGDASIHGQIEYYDGRVYTIPEQTGGTQVGNEGSDTISVMLDLDCEEIDELLFATAPAA